MGKAARITIPTEPTGSIPRPVDLIERVAMSDSEAPNLDPLYEDAIRDTRKPDQRIFAGLITPIERYVEASEEMRGRLFAASQPDGGPWLP